MNKERTSILTLRGWRDYLLQVSLILLSLLIAVGIDRCNQKARGEERLEDYLGQIRQELKDEYNTTDNNVVDAGNDIKDLEFALANIKDADQEMLAQVVARVARVMGRGVFRAFPPSTYDQMVVAGDASLIRDIALRDRLASTFSFRDDYIQQDLRQYDAMVLEVIDRLSEYLDLGHLVANRGENPLKSVRDMQQLRERLGIDLTKLGRMAQLRAFHLELYRNSLVKTAEFVEETYGEDPLSTAAPPADPPAPPSE